MDAEQGGKFVPTDEFVSAKTCSIHRPESRRNHLSLGDFPRFLFVILNNIIYFNFSSVKVILRLVITSFVFFFFFNIKYLSFIVGLLWFSFHKQDFVQLGLVSQCLSQLQSSSLSVLVVKPALQVPFSRSLKKCIFFSLSFYVIDE